MAPENFELPFNGQHFLGNPWVVIASLIASQDLVDEYAINFSI
ncbi:hypothetical protein VV11_017635 [Trichodesmium erythraeum 21-75]|nr:hypothetical protein [Trichodesmium erythraeum 21-75]